MPNKSHKNALNYCKKEIEKNNFRCKRELDLSRGKFLNAVDLACFGDNQTINAVGIEVESTPKERWNSNKQIISNELDLKEFSRIHPKSKTWHLHIDDVE